MLAYIRTKDGRIIKGNDGILIDSDIPRGGSYKSCNGVYYLSKADILKQANTIEELCDGFWWENTMYTEPIFIPNFGLVLDRVKAWKESDKELDDNSFDKITIYGSLYIHGYGWKHVCKVNKNEERLELL